MQIELTPYPTHLPQELQTVLQIIDDGLSQGFQFIVENHTLYYYDPVNPDTNC